MSDDLYRARTVSVVDTVLSRKINILYSHLTLCQIAGHFRAAVNDIN